MFTKQLYVKWSSYDCCNTVSLGYKDQPMEGNGYRAELKMLTPSKCLRVDNISICVCLLHMSDLLEFKIHDALLNTLIKQTHTQDIHSPQTPQTLLD